MFLKEVFCFFVFLFMAVLGLRFSVRGLSLFAASGGHSSSRCAGLSLSRPLLLRSTGSRRAGSVIVAHGPSCSAACGIFPDQGSNLCPLHWQADSQPLHHQGSPLKKFFNAFLLDINPGAELHSHSICTSSALVGCVQNFSKVVVPIYLFSIQQCILHPCQRLVLSVFCILAFLVGMLLVSPCNFNFDFPED